MDKYRRRLWIIISAAVIWSALLIWLIFSPKLLHAIAQMRALFIFLAIAAIVQIIFFPRLARRVPGHGKALAVLAVSLVLNSMCLIANFVLDQDNLWLDRIFDLSRLLRYSACLMFIWVAVRQSRAKKREARKVGD